MLKGLGHQMDWAIMALYAWIELDLKKGSRIVIEFLGPLWFSNDINVFLPVIT